jgi:programmed cell death 8 (apoptosis-inducing factor)
MTSKVQADGFNEKVAQTLGTNDDRLQATYVLIGAGTAAYSAMKAILAQDPHADILIVGEEKEVPYMRPPLSKDLWFQEDSKLAAKLQFEDKKGNPRT